MTQTRTRAALRPRRTRQRGTVIGLAAGALVLLGVGGAAAADATASDGYVSLGARGTYSTDGYALTTDGTDWHTQLAGLVGTVRVRVAPAGDTRPIFAGVADPAAVQGYLAGARYTTIHNGPTRTEHGGTAPRPPATALPWTTTATGSGTQTLQWPAAAGEQVLVVMNADGSPSVRGRVESVAVSLRGIAWIAAALLGCGVALLAAAVAVVRRTRAARSQPDGVGP